MSQSKAVLAALAAIFACPLAASAQDKKTTGTITAMQAGDIACYLTLRDDAGAPFREMADFEICEQRGLLNKRVSLAYKASRVQAASCQGDPDCKKSDTVMLVVSARPLPVTGGAPSASPPSTPPVTASKPAAPSPNTAARTHCTGGETVVFSCVTGAKAVSVCAVWHVPGLVQRVQLVSLQTLPTQVAAPVQVTHISAAVPQAVVAVPGWHTPVELQHPAQLC